jgi:hypothetical protein
MKIGIEQEFVFKDQLGRYLDLENSEFALFRDIVNRFPVFAGDEAVFECKSLEQAPKRCYVEGFEHYGPDGKPLATLPKGLEIRTLPHTTVDGVVEEFQNTYSHVMRIAKHFSVSPVLTSRHPFKSSSSFCLPVKSLQNSVRSERELSVAIPSMLTHGLHVNVSISGRSYEYMEGLVDKVNHFMPSLIPYSFSSPFYDGKVFEGLCSRNYFRAETRQLVELHNRRGDWILEFRAFDACGDARLLSGLLTLFKGLLLDETLTERSPAQDPERLRQSSLFGFDEPDIRKQGLVVLSAAKKALGEEANKLVGFEEKLKENDSYAARMKQAFLETGDIITCISNQYDY